MSIRRSLVSTASRRALAAGLTLPIMAAVCVSFASAAEAGELRGRVLNAITKTPAPGALVRLDGATTEVTTGDDGIFEMHDVGAGPHTLTVSYIGFPDTQAIVTAKEDGPLVQIAIGARAEAAEEIVVSGRREAERKALQSKLVSDAIEDVLYADDVGKLPDQNVAEAVKRLPGISVANDQGEGRYVIIRGVNPNLVNVTLNGQTAPVPEPEGRQIKLDDIPSAMIGSVEVIKSLTPDRDANAIAGQLDISTLSAFDRNKALFGNARAYYGYYDINAKHPYGGDATVGGVFGGDDQFGIVLSANYDRRPIRSENIQGSTNWRLVNGFVVPDDFRIRDYSLVRERTGAVANFDWRPNDDLKLHLRSTYSKFTDNETRDQFRLEIATPITSQTATTGNFLSRGTRFVRRREEDDKSYNINTGGVLDLGEGKLDADFTYSRAEKKDPLRSEFQFRTGSNAIASTYDLSSDPFLVTPGSAGYNSALFAARSVNYDKRLAVDKLYQATANYKLPVEIGDNSFFKTGVKYAKRDKVNNRDYQTYNLSGFTLDDVDVLGHNATYDGRYVVGPRVDYNQAQALVTARPTTMTLDVAGSRVNDLANDYQVHEKVLAAYVMGNLKFDKLTVVPGVRMERTEQDFAAKVITATSALGQDFNSFNSRAYTNWFPGVNLRYDVQKDLVVRGAVTTAIGRPNYADLPNYISVDTAAGTVTQGNPNLKPLRAVNFDAAIEYYLPNQGVISLGAFYKKIKDPIYSQTLINQSGTYGGVALTNIALTTPMNSSDAKVKGIELNAQSQLTFLPSPFDGLGLGGSITFVDGKQSGFSGRTDETPMALQSNRVATAQVYYEKYGFSARLAYSYRSRYLDTVGASAATDQYTDSNGSLDARVAYDFTQNVQVFVEGANLTDAPWRRFIGTKAQLVENERYGWSVRTGLQFKY